MGQVADGPRKVRRLDREVQGVVPAAQATATRALFISDFVIPLIETMDTIAGRSSQRDARTHRFNQR